MGNLKNACLKKCFGWTFVLRIVMIISLVLALWRKDYVWVVGTFIGLFISFLPSIFKRDLKLTLPWVLDFLIALISILHMGGRLLDYYYTISGYIYITRFFISIFVAFLGFTMIYILDEYWDGLKMDKYAMAFISVIFTMAIGVLLEFIKWLNITGTYYIRSNQILMLNLSLDTIAGIAIAIIGVSLIKSGEFDEMTEDFGKQINKTIINRKRKTLVEKQDK